MSQLPPPLRGCSVCGHLLQPKKNALTVHGNGAKNGGHAPLSNGKVSDGRWVASRHKTQGTSVYKSGFYFQTEVMMPGSCFQPFKQYTYSKTTSHLLFPLPNIILTCSQKMDFVHGGKLGTVAHCSFVRNRRVQICQPCWAGKKNDHHGICQN